jgi:hypothetical protein
MGGRSEKRERERERESRVHPILIEDQGVEAGITLEKNGQGPPLADEFCARRGGGLR